MTYEEAFDADDITLHEALKELKDHGCDAYTKASGIIVDMDDCAIAEPDSLGLYCGGDLMAYLGY